MLRIVPIKFLGHEYDLCFSVSVMMRLEDEKLDMESTRGTVAALSALMEAGDAAARLEGKPGKGFLTAEQIAFSCQPADLAGVMGSIMDAMNIQPRRKVETADSPKNAEKTSPGA